MKPSVFIYKVILFILSPFFIFGMIYQIKDEGLAFGILFIIPLLIVIIFKSIFRFLASRDFFEPFKKKLISDLKDSFLTH